MKTAELKELLLVQIPKDFISSALVHLNYKSKICRGAVVRTSDERIDRN